MLIMKTLGLMSPWPCLMSLWATGVAVTIDSTSATVASSRPAMVVRWLRISELCWRN